MRKYCRDSSRTFRRFALTGSAVPCKTGRGKEATRTVDPSLTEVAIDQYCGLIWQGAVIQLQESLNVLQHVDNFIIGA